MDLAALALATLLYPGLLTALVAGAVYSLVLRGRGALPAGLSALRTREGLASASGLLLAGVGLATLPWPLHPAGGGAAWLWGWAAFELAFLLPLVPALRAGAPPVVRAAIREAQIGALARAVLWAALSVGLALHEVWAGAALAAHLLALGGALAAFPAAIGWGPFGPETRVTPGGTAAGLRDEGRTIEAWARDFRGGALLAAVLVAGLPAGALPPPLGLGLVVVGLALGALLLRSFAGRLPRMTLPAALRFCLVWPLPLALAATLALTVAARG
jgi:hypothetical protein